MSGLSAFRTLRLLRAMRMFKFIRYFKSLQTVLAVVSRTVVPLLWILLLIFVMVVVFALVATQLFRGDDNPDSLPTDTFFNFDTFTGSMMTMFVLLIAKAWTPIM